jgi:hypothetical protein
METESLANNAARASEAFLDRKSQTMRTRLTYLCSLALMWLSFLPSIPAVAGALTNTTNPYMSTEAAICRR